jgi:pentatricopeptide repeat protein
LYLAGNYDAAIRTWQKTIELDPNFQATYVYMPAAYAQLGRYDEAVEWFQKMPMKSGADWAYAQGGLGNLYAVTGRDKEALEVIEQLKRASATQYAPAPALALVYTGLGDKDEAFFWLDRAVEERAFQLQWIKVEPRWESLRSDPRFTNIIRRMALP